MSRAGGQSPGLRSERSSSGGNPGQNGGALFTLDRCIQFLCPSHRTAVCVTSKTCAGAFHLGCRLFARTKFLVRTQSPGLRLCTSPSKGGDQVSLTNLWCPQIVRLVVFRQHVSIRKEQLGDLCRGLLCREASRDFR